jgi:hypothetical protein
LKIINKILASRKYTPSPFGKTPNKEISIKIITKTLLNFILNSSLFIVLLDNNTGTI